MKYLNTYKLFESNDQFLKTIEEIENWLFSQRIKNYIINDDLTVDVKGGLFNNVYISGKSVYNIPVQFGFIDGDFGIRETYVKSLKGCPHTVKGDFYCNHNELESLEFCPKYIEKNFFCQSNKLTNLNGCPSRINGHFYCDMNNLKSYNGCPLEVDGEFLFFSNPLDSMFYPIIQKERNQSNSDKVSLNFIKYLNEYDVIVDKKIYVNRFKDALYMIDFDNYDINQLNYLPKDFTIIN